MRRIISLILILAMMLTLLAAFIACDAGDAPGTETETGEGEDNQPSTKKITVAENGSSSYKIVYPVDFSNKEKSLTTELQSAIKSVSGATLEIVTDDVAESQYEILVGNTNRRESADAKAMIGDDEYIITVINGITWNRSRWRNARHM